VAGSKAQRFSKSREVILSLKNKFKCMDKFSHFWGLCFLIVPFCFNNRFDFSTFHLMLFFTAAVISMLAFGSCRTFKKLDLICISVFLICSTWNIFIPVISAGNSSSEILGKKYLLADNYGHILLQFLAISFVPLIINHFSSHAFGQGRRIVSKYLGVACIIHSLFMIGEYWGVNYYDIMAVPSKTSAYAGVLANSGYSGLYIAITLPFVLFNWWYLSIVPVIAVTLLTVFQTSITPILAICTSLLLMALNKSKVFLLLPIAVAIPLWETIKSNFLKDPRIDKWKLAWVHFDKYFLGQGMSWIQSKFYFLKSTGTPFNKLHNDPYELLIVFGIVGVVCVLIFMRDVFKMRYSEYSLALYSVLFSSLFWFVFRLPSISVLSLYFIAISKKEKNI